MQADQTLDMLPQLDDPKECLKRAVKCERLAKSGADRKAEAMLLELARHWREMATEIEFLGGAPKKQSEQTHP